MEKIRVEIQDDISSGDFHELLIKAAYAVINYEKIYSPIDLSISIVDEKEIWELNLKHRDVDRPTDVLSFPLLDLYKSENKAEIIKSNLVNIGYQTTFLGDIVLCLDVAKKQAYEYEHSLERELAFLTVHSVLHLLGYDHIKEDDEIIMRTKQRDIMEILKLNKI